CIYIGRRYNVRDVMSSDTARFGRNHSGMTAHCRTYSRLVVKVKLQPERESTCPETLKQASKNLSMGIVFRKCGRRVSVDGPTPSLVCTTHFEGASFVSLLNTFIAEVDDVVVESTGQNPTPCVELD